MALRDATTKKKEFLLSEIEDMAKMEEIKREEERLAQFVSKMSNTDIYKSFSKLGHVRDL